MTGNATIFYPFGTSWVFQYGPTSNPQGINFDVPPIIVFSVLVFPISHSPPVDSSPRLISRISSLLVSLLFIDLSLSFPHRLLSISRHSRFGLFLLRVYLGFTPEFSYHRLIHFFLEFCLFLVLIFSPSPPASYVPSRFVSRPFFVAIPKFPVISTAQRLICPRYPILPSTVSAAHYPASHF